MAQVSAETVKSISTPDGVETRLGTLEFEDGAPSDATEQAAAITRLCMTTAPDPARDDRHEPDSVPSGAPDERITAHV